MNKKIIFGVIAVIIVAILVVIGVLTFGKKEVSIDLAKLNQEIIKKGPFGEMATMTIDKETVENLYTIQSSQIEEVIGEMPLMNVQASMFIVIKATDGNVEEVKTKVDEYAKNYEEMWSRYLPEQHEFVQNRKVGVKGNYVYMIICENAEEVEALIK